MSERTEPKLLVRPTPNVRRYTIGDAVEAMRRMGAPECCIQAMVRHATAVTPVCRVQGPPK